VLPPRLAEPEKKDIIPRVEKQDPDVVPSPPQLLDDPREIGRSTGGRLSMQK
jgi:hypothetical protein